LLNRISDKQSETLHLRLYTKNKPIIVKIQCCGSGFGIRNPEKPIPDLGSKGSERHRIPDPDPQHCIYLVDNPFNNNVTYLVSLLEVGGLLQSCARVLVIFLLVFRLTDLLIGVKEDHL